MNDENQMRAALQAYLDAFNAGDAEAVAALYSDDASVEDPVGSEPIRGREAITAFYRRAIAYGGHLRREEPIRASHGQEAAMAFFVDIDLGQGPVSIQVIDVMRFDAAGRFSSMRAFWGPGDIIPARRD